MSTARELRDVLATIGVRPSWKLGQNFLVDANLLDAMVREAAPRPGQVILEVGPGTGILTRRLLDAGCFVTAVELDRRLAAYLQQELAGHPGFRLVQGDACRLAYDELLGHTPYRCISNLPYACSSVFLATLAGLDNAPLDMHVLLQREMAARLAACPRSADYGALSVRLQLRYSARILRAVPAQVFWPAPEVGSAFVRLEALPQPLPEEVRRLAGDLAALAFSQRRKRAMKLLTERLGGPDRARHAFAAAGLHPDARAEELAPGDFVRLAGCL